MCYTLPYSHYDWSKTVEEYIDSGEFDEGVTKIVSKARDDVEGSEELRLMMTLLFSAQTFAMQQKEARKTVKKTPKKKNKKPFFVC